MKERRVTVATGFWTDPDLEGWAPLTKYLYLYLYGNEHVHGLTGVGHASDRRIRSETNLTTAQIARARDQIGDRVLWFDGGAYLVQARSRHTCYKADWTPSPNHVAGAWNSLRGEPPAIVSAWCNRYPDLERFARGMKGACDPPGNPSEGPGKGMGRGGPPEAEADSESIDTRQRHRQKHAGHPPVTHPPQARTDPEGLLLRAAKGVQLNGPALARLLEVARSDGPEAGPAYALAILRYAEAKGERPAALAASILAGDQKIDARPFYDGAKQALRTWCDRCEKARRT